jgi:hypothetical protein
MKTYRALTSSGLDLGTFKAPSKKEAIAYAALMMGSGLTVKKA